MKKITKLVIAITVVSLGTILISEFSSPAHSNVSGAPAGRTGSPADGATCTNGCHVGGGIGTAAGTITSTVPSGGYTPGATYTITATAPVGSSLSAKYGFQVSPQNVGGTLLGTLVVTNSTRTQLVGSGKYITHTQAGTAPVPSVGGNSWTFNWIAPAAGTGAVTFYGAFNSADGTGSTSGDMISQGTLTVQEATGGVGINDIAAVNNNWSVYPSPANTTIQLTNSFLQEGNVNVAIIDVTGKKVKEIKAYDVIQKEKIDIADLKSGIYVISITSENGTINKKIIKK